MGLTFDGSLSQWAEVTGWSGPPPCLTHPDTCRSGASVLAWVKLTTSCSYPNGIFGTQGNAGTSNTDGLIVIGQGATSGGNSFK